MLLAFVNDIAGQNVTFISTALFHFVATVADAGVVTAFPADFRSGLVSILFCRVCFLVSGSRRAVEFILDLTVKWTLLYLCLARLTRDTICGQIRVWSIDIGPEIYVESMSVWCVTCLSLSVAIHAEVKVAMVVATFWAI